MELELLEEGTSFVEGRLNLVDVLAILVDVPMRVDLGPWWESFWYHVVSARSASVTRTSGN